MHKYEWGCTPSCDWLWLSYFITTDSLQVLEQERGLNLPKAKHREDGCCRVRELALASLLRADFSFFFFFLCARWPCLKSCRSWSLPPSFRSHRPVNVSLFRAVVLIQDRSLLYGSRFESKLMASFVNVIKWTEWIRVGSCFKGRRGCKGKCTSFKWITPAQCSQRMRKKYIYLYFMVKCLFLSTAYTDLCTPALWCYDDITF